MEIEHPDLNTHILFVGKSIPLSTMVEEYFSKYGLTYDQFNSNEEALDTFKTHVDRYTLIIIDASQEHGASEIEFTKNIRFIRTQKRQVPILAVSDLGDDDRRSALLDAGCNDFLSTPFHLDDLAARANILLTNQHLLQKIDAQQQQMQTIRITDQKTGLYSRNFLADHGIKLIALAKRQNFPISLIIVDIDDFRKINDKYGLQTGDIVIQSIAILINSTCRSEDIVTRYDAEEFAVLLPYCGKVGATDKAERLSADIKKLKPDNLDVSASFGIATIPVGETGGWETMLRSAQESLKEAQKTKQSK